MKNNSNYKEELSIRSIYKILLIHKKFFIVFMMLAFMLIIIYSFFMPYTYESTASALPPDENENKTNLSSFLSSFSGGMPSIMSQGGRLMLLGDILKSRELGNYVVQKTKLDTLPNFKSKNKEILISYVLNCLDVQILRTSLILVTSSVHTNYFSNDNDKRIAANLSTDFCNYALEGLDYINRNKSVSKARKKRIFIERILLEKSKRLDSIDRALEEFQRKNKILAIDEQTKAILDRSVTIGTELSTAEIDMGLMGLDYNQESPKLNAYKKKIESLRNQYNKSQSGGIIPDDKFSIPLKEVPTLYREYTNLLREQKILLQVSTYLETQKYQEAIQEESDVSTIEPLDKAIVPFNQAAPNLSNMLVLGFIISTFLAVFIIIIIAYRKGMIYIKQFGSENI